MPSYKEVRELRIACKRDDLLPSLREYYPHRETCEPECGIPVERFYKETQKYEEEGLFSHTEDDVWGWRILLTADVSVAEIPVEMLKKQDMVLVYRMSSDEHLVECVYSLFPLQKEDLGETASDPAIFCFANVDAAKEFVRFIGWEMLDDCKVINLDYSDVLTAFASRRGNILYISKKIMIPQEELSAKDVVVQGALFIFRGDKQLSMYEVCVPSEKISDYFSDGTSLLWVVELSEERSVTALLARRLPYTGLRPCYVFRIDCKEHFLFVFSPSSEGHSCRVWHERATMETMQERVEYREIRTKNFNPYSGCFLLIPSVWLKQDEPSEAYFTIARHISDAHCGFSDFEGAKTKEERRAAARRSDENEDEEFSPMECCARLKRRLTRRVKALSKWDCNATKRTYYALVQWSGDHTYSTHGGVGADYTIVEPLLSLPYNLNDDTRTIAEALKHEDFAAYRISSLAVENAVLGLISDEEIDIEDNGRLD